LLLRFLSFVCVYRLKKLSEAIFDCFIDPAYRDQPYLFEKRIHVEKTLFFIAISAISAIRAKKYQMLFAILQDISALRRRVTDFSTFKIAERELKLVSDAMDACWRDLLRYPKQPVKTVLLEEAIGEFEQLVENILCNASPEPLVFSLFTFNLRALCSHLRQNN